MFAITKGEVGGAQEHVRILAQGLVEKGNQVATLVSPGSDLERCAVGVGATAYPWCSIAPTAAPLSNLSARSELRAAVRDWKPDVLHLHSSVAGAVGTGVLCPPQGVTIFTCHHAAFGKNRTWTHRALSRPVAQVTFRRMDGIISVGARDLRAIARLAKNVPVALVRNTVPASGPPLTDGALRPNAVWVARLAPPKDPMLAVAAWERVAEQIPGAHLTFCGTGPLEEELRSRVERSEAYSNMFVAGFVADTKPVIADASIFLLVSKIEGGISLATLEAMAQGLVPVVTDAGDAQLLVDNECGVVVDADPDSIAEGVIHLLSDPLKYEYLRQRAISFVRDRTVDDFVDETLHFYNRVLNQTPIGAS
jgi:glycosyltransferase involved in cell wall biosynthesis